MHHSDGVMGSRTPCTEWYSSLQWKTCNAFQLFLQSYIPSISDKRLFKISRLRYRVIRSLTYLSPFLIINTRFERNFYQAIQENQIENKFLEHFRCKVQQQDRVWKIANCMFFSGGALCEMKIIILLEKEITRSVIEF